MFHTVINSLSNVLGGDQRPRVHVIVGPVIMRLGSKIHVGITDRFRLQFKAFVNLVEHGHSTKMNYEGVFDISQDVGVLAITTNVNFGIDPHVQVIWTKVVTHMYHTVIQVLAEIRFRTLQSIEITNYD